MDIHLMEITKNGVKVWAYWYVEEGTRKKRQRVCKGCKTRDEAELYVSEIRKRHSQPLVRHITRDMYVEGKPHLTRLQQMGKKLSQSTINGNRRFLDLIEKQFGDMELSQLTVPVITNYLITLNRSGSWKNSYLEVLNQVFEEAPWIVGLNIPKPGYPRFIRNSKKGDVFLTEELKMLFDRAWSDPDAKMLFFTIASCGLRLGEARALQARQLLPQQRCLVIDGFCLEDGTRTTYNKKGSVDDSHLRVVVVPDDTLIKLMDYMQKHHRRGYDFIFQRNDKPLRREYLDALFKRQVLASGILVKDRKLTPHSLRFTYITRMRRNLSGDVVQKLAGHSSIEMTDYYTRASLPELMAGVQEALPAANRLFVD